MSGQSFYRDRTNLPRNQPVQVYRISKLLLQNSADPNIGGESPILHHAIYQRSTRMVKLLLKYNADPLIKQNIYSLIARQIQITMMAEGKENFAFKILDPPRVPDRKIRPMIRTNIIISFIVSLFAGICLAFFMEYMKNIKSSYTKSGEE